MKPFNYRVRIHNKEGMAALEYIGIAGDIDDGLAGEIIAFLAGNSGREWTTSELRDQVSGNWTKDQFEWALGKLRRTGKVTVESLGRGRPGCVKLIHVPVTGIQPEPNRNMWPYGDAS